jgi:hypothetical protein
MKYMLMIYANQQTWAGLSPARVVRVRASARASRK